MYCGKAFMTLVGAEITVRQPTELEVEEWERSNAATGMLHIVLPKPEQRQSGEAIKVRMGRDSLGRYFWFEEPPLFYSKSPPPGTEVYGPFATEAGCEESQQLVLLGPQCEVEHGGTWPAWDPRNSLGEEG